MWVGALNPGMLCVMREPKTKCKDCGVSILQRTADRYRRRRVPCHREATVAVYVPKEPNNLKKHKSWSVRLWRFFKEYHFKNPIPQPETLSRPEKVQCRIIGEALIDRLKREAPELLQQGTVLRPAMGTTSKLPWVKLFITSIPGLVAAKEMLGEERQGIVYLLADEFAEWPGPVDEFGFPFGVFGEFSSFVDTDLIRKVCLQKHTWN